VKASPYKNYSDPELIAMCLRGEKRAWDALIRRYKRFIFAIPIKFGFPESDSSDVFQTICVKLLEHLHEIKDDRKISGWLATTTTRQCLAMWNMKQRDSGTEEEVEEPLDPMGSLEDVKLLAERHQLLREAVEQLPDRCRSLIEMLYLDITTPSYEEIAERLGIPEPSVGPNRARCLDKLRIMLRHRGINTPWNK
jgi:RNA polymerase sigma factor (sigma-70 family)